MAQKAKSKQKNIRIRKDAFGEISVPKGVYFDKETARWLKNFGIGEPLPIAFISSLAHVKKACAFANRDCGVITAKQAKMIGEACDEIIAGKYTDQFPVSMFQSGSGTYTNMNMNEVIARIAHVRQGGHIDDEVTVIHPNDVVNRSQSTNDIFPTAMYVASVLALQEQVLPSVSNLVEVFRSKGEEYADVKVADEEMKGRIIGKEGRNIRAFEQATGVDVDLDEGKSCVLHTTISLATLALYPIIQIVVKY